MYVCTCARKVGISFLLWITFALRTTYTYYVYVLRIRTTYYYVLLRTTTYYYVVRITYYVYVYVLRTTYTYTCYVLLRTTTYYVFWRVPGKFSRACQNSVNTMCFGGFHENVAKT